MVDNVRDSDIYPGSPIDESHARLTITGHTDYVTGTHAEVSVHRVETDVPGEATIIRTYMCRYESETGAYDTEIIIVSDEFDFDRSDARAVAYGLIPVTSSIDVVVGVDDTGEDTVYEMERVLGEEMVGVITVTVPNNVESGGDNE